jgi:predicted nucleotidyltransferase
MQVRIDLPLPDHSVFRYGAADDILTLVATHPNRVFTNREFRRLTGYGGPSVQNALDLLSALDLLVKDVQDSRTEYRINSARVDGPLTGIGALPQAEFHAPIRAFRERVLEAVPDLRGIIVFGSVARGEADRRSDIDVFVTVQSAPPMEARRTVADILADIEEETFNDHRYAFDQHVESMAETRAYGERIMTIMTEGIPIYTTDEFDELRATMLDETTTTEEAISNE